MSRELMDGLIATRDSNRKMKNRRKKIEKRCSCIENAMIVDRWEP